MKKMIFFVLGIGILFFALQGTITIAGSEELSKIKGAEYKDNSILKGEYCGHPSAPSGQDGCTYVSVPAYPMYGWRCDGSCAPWCVSTDIKYYCSCSLGNKCDTTNEHNCTGGTLYKSTSQCEKVGYHGCTTCTYYQSSDGC